MIKEHMGSRPEVDASAYINELAYVSGKVVVGPNVSIWPFTSIRGDIESIHIGANTNIQDNCVLHTKKDMRLIIGENVTIGHGAILHSCTIGNNCLIGMGAIVLDGAVIKDNTMVGAGSVVVPGSELESCSLYLGTPAKKKKDLNGDEISKMTENYKSYIKLSKDYFK